MILYGPIFFVIYLVVDASLFPGLIYIAYLIFISDCRRIFAGRHQRRIALVSVGYNTTIGNCNEVGYHVFARDRLAGCGL